MKKNNLDQFYTNPRIADYLVKKIDEMFQLEQFTIFEPAAGTGNFIRAFEKRGIDITRQCVAFDLEPKGQKLIKKADFLSVDLSLFNKNKNIVITNPPFGKRCHLAVQFLNKSLMLADIVCMILPNTFNRYLTQKQIKHDAKLIYSESLPFNSFIVNDREYNVKCVFQIWTNKNIKTWLTDHRLRNNNFQTLPGLTLYTHNNTKETMKFFDKDKYRWNFAVVRQGYYDYSKKIRNPNDLVPNRQYLFIKTENQYLLDLINQVDFTKLSESNTSVRGFSNTDLINELYQMHINRILKFYEQEKEKWF
ncbi:hypothetical protein [Ureaplasma canigenitalium]|uniref:hypothetical protein n=1 Tax=Ureaplasma canigenitalium TaxID=42092 RepID=UPI000691E705|nr:hypothetical protein [Ureaplasma canigenitalium]